LAVQFGGNGNQLLGNPAVSGAVICDKFGKFHQLAGNFRNGVRLIPGGQFNGLAIGGLECSCDCLRFV